MLPKNLPISLLGFPCIDLDWGLLKNSVSVNGQISRHPNMIQWEVIALTSLKSPAMSICHWEEWIFHYVFIIDFYLNYIIANSLK